MRRGSTARGGGRVLVRGRGTMRRGGRGTMRGRGMLLQLSQLLVPEIFQPPLELAVLPSKHVHHTHRLPAPALPGLERGCGTTRGRDFMQSHSWKRGRGQEHGTRLQGGGKGCQRTLRRG